MKKSSKAFTLVEILVVIAVIGILALGASRLNFSRTSQVELLNIESIKILALIEEMRNNALVWRAVSAWWEIPENWRITFDITNDSYAAGYLRTSWTTETTINSNIRSPFGIMDIRCIWINNADLWNISNVGSIEFSTAGLTTINWCSNDDARILHIQIWHLSITKTIRVNIITNVIEEI